MGILSLNDLTGGLYTPDDYTKVKKRVVFVEMQNVYYNDQKQIQTRRGYEAFGDNVGSDPFTSLFFFQRDDTAERFLYGVAGGTLYKYNDGTSQWDSVVTNLIATENDGTTKTKWDFAVYRNIVYACDGVNPYMSIEDTTVTQQIAAADTVTFTNGTNIVNNATHGYSDDDEVLFRNSGGALPAELTENRVYYIVNSDTNDYQLSLTPGGSVVTFTDDGTGTHSEHKLNEPRYRYIEYIQDRVFGAGQDLNPSTLYYSNAAAANADTIDTNSVVVGGDELGRINGIRELGQIIVVGKDDKVYTVDVATPSALPIDSREGLRSNRGIQNVENAVLYSNERGINVLRQKVTSIGSQALAVEPLSDNIKDLFDNVKPRRLQETASLYINELTNFYFTFDNTDSGRPNETILWSSLTASWSRYTLPNLYDYVKYIDSDGNFQYLIASATGGQCFEIEKGFDDNGVEIPYKITFKEDLNDQGIKVWRWFEIYGFKSKGVDVSVTIQLDEDSVGTATIDDTYIIDDSASITVGSTPIGDASIGGEEASEGIDVFPFVVRIPMEAAGREIEVVQESEAKGQVFILTKYRINVDNEVIDLFPEINYA